MAQLLRMPEISANTVEAVLSEWPLAENTPFRAGDAIATVETEKAVVDVPADADGVLVRTLVEPGKSVSVGTPMAVLADPGEVIADLDALVAELTGGEAPARADAPTPAGTREVTQSAEPSAGEAPGQPVTDGALVGALDGLAATNGAAATAGTDRVFASPIARRIAKENGLSVRDIPGTGPGGRIVRDDVRRVIQARLATPERATGDLAAADISLAATTATSGEVPGAGVSSSDLVRDGGDAAGSAGSGYRDIPHTRMRRAIATRLAQSHREAPVFTIRGSARVDALLALRKDLNEATGVRISVNDLIVAAAARAHVAVPEMNVVWTSDAVRQFEDVDIAVAVATDNGLVTPVVRGVQRLTVSALARTGADAVARARDGKLRQDELEGGTLTVTNLGVFGTEDFTAVINPPQAAILAVGAARPEAVVTDGDLGVATVLRVSLSVDHRPVDGATAARWMAAFLALLESPLRILA
jgi:pyruvate dehydrogenase E2 component (dihydrolipoamide acetyltransferase)